MPLANQRQILHDTTPPGSDRYPSRGQWLQSSLAKPASAEGFMSSCLSQAHVRLYVQFATFNSTDNMFNGSFFLSTNIAFLLEVVQKCFGGLFNTVSLAVH